MTLSRRFPTGVVVWFWTLNDSCMQVSGLNRPPSSRKESIKRLIHIMFATGLLVGATVFAVGSVVVLSGPAIRQAYEPQSAAEERCAFIAPSDGVDSVAWTRCVEREASASPAGVEMPRIIRALAVICLALVAGVFLLVPLFRANQPPAV
jgi:hypothetical protein